jgi:LmbE family N-acetylglucosaminyl deacetylase
MPVAVFFGAHPDDIELGAGGTCAKLCAAGFDVRIVVATDDINPGVASIRRHEATAAAGILGIPTSRVYFLGLIDGRFRCDMDAVARLRALFLDLHIHPDAIFTHSEADSHQDHVELTRIVKAAFRRVGLFKYRVMNSAIPSHFKPSISSEIADFVEAKIAALSRHKSQRAAGRINPAKASHERLEAFELEIQEGAANFLEILDRVNDAPFSRFWLPLCAGRAITIIAPPTRHPHPKHSHKHVLSCAPSDLQLVTRLQHELTTVMHKRLSVELAPKFIAEEANGARLNMLATGTSLILGGPAVNPAAQPFLERITRVRFRADFASSRYRGYPIIDTHTGRLFEPSFAPSPRASIELERDYGLLTIARLNDPAGEASLVIAAMGVHAAGTAAVFSCLLLPEHLARIVEDARRVIDGEASWAQWLVPGTGAGVPIVAEIEGYVNEQRRSPQKSKQTRSAERPRTKGMARAC